MQNLGLTIENYKKLMCKMASLVNAVNTAKFDVIVKIYTELKDICATLVVDKAEENR